MKLKKILSISIAILSVFTFCACKKNNDDHTDSNIISLQIEADKKHYKVGEEIKLRFKIVNVSDETLELPVNDSSYLYSLLSIGAKRGENISYGKSIIARKLLEPVSKEMSFIFIKPGEEISETMLIKINPIKRLTIIPYDIERIFLKLRIKEENYPEKVESFFKHALGDYKSNEFDLSVDSKSYTELSDQYIDTDYIVRFFKMTAENTDQLVTKGFVFSIDDMLLKNDLDDVNRYLKVFYKSNNKPYFFEFYANNELKAYAELKYTKSEFVSDFIMYSTSGLIDLRYEAIKINADEVRWDKYIVDYLKGIDYFLGYIKVTRYDTGVYVSELMMDTGDSKFRRFMYNKKGSIIKREDALPPEGTQMRKRKF